MSQLVKEMASSTSLKEELKGCIKQVCESDFGGDLILQGTDDCFDALCNIGASHGHDMGTLGPPCACSFTHCMSCLEHLVTIWKEAQASVTPPDEVVHLEETKVVTMMELLADEDWMDSSIILEGLPYKTEITDALNKMRDTLWEAAGELKALHIQTWKVSREFISGLTGLELYYTVAMRELIAAGPPPTVSTGTPVPAIELHRKRDGTVPSLREHHTQLKKDVDRLLKTDEKQRPALEAMSIGYRRVLARHFRDLGNTAYTMSEYVIANGLYTRAISYDAEDPIYPLNRAACRIKLKCFSSAETDCSSTLSMDPTNYKAFFRRGVSKVGQGRYEQAKRDFEEVLKLQKHNPAALKELKDLEAKRLAGKGGQAKADGSRAPTKKSPPSVSKPVKGKDRHTFPAISASGATAPIISESPVFDEPKAEQTDQSVLQTSTPQVDLAPVEKAGTSPGSCIRPVPETTLLCTGLVAAAEDALLPATAFSEPLEEAGEVALVLCTHDTMAFEDQEEKTCSKDTLPLPTALPLPSKSETFLTSDVDGSEDAEDAEDYRAHAARVAKLLDGLQHCKANMDSADAAKRKEAIASASQLVKEYEATEVESHLLLQKAAQRTEAMSNATAKVSRPRAHRFTSRNKSSLAAKPKIEENDPGAPGASETSEQRKTRLDRETRDQLYFTWAFIHIIQQRTGALVLKSQRHRPDGILAIDILNGSVAEPARRDSDSGIEQSPVAKSRRKLRGKLRGV